MARLLLLTFLLIGTLPGITQIVGDRANKYAVQNSIDTFLVYSFPCSGGISFDTPPTRALPARLLDTLHLQQKTL
jgi:hypothetical protein